MLQGEIIDRIEEEVTKTVDHVVAGNKELDEAAKNRRKARKVGDITYDIISVLLPYA